ncbi:indolepyruvate ferredoxin oxidoreductase family protein [Rhodococcus pseudokoreensis]|uniref:indolepyruvate ferredoxin oxidoreductase family protein n=1 Tax=Rhodococcus pseudokoreensis TaxID=2811421 RepID=UPI001F1263AA|nr:indolepyruvate ferredoxin oxidoreductase family protein [Rhodococcus pseudokoreensis]
MTATADRPVRLEDRYNAIDGEIYLSGLQALVRIPLDQMRLDRRSGLNTATFISGYEGSPLAGYDLELTRQRKLLDEHNVVFKPSVNEELAATAVMGSQLVSTLEEQNYDGVVGIWYGKAPGLDRSTDALRHANLGGSAPTGGALVLVGDDSIAKSSTVPSSSETAMAEIGMTVLSPADPQDVLDLGLHGVALSRFCGLWTGLKLATNVMDGSGVAVARTDQFQPVFPEREIDGRPYNHTVSAYFLQPKLAELENSMMGSRTELARRYAHANHLNKIEGDPEAKVGIVAAGTTYLDVHQALKTLGIAPDELASSGIRILKLGMISPLEPRILHEFATGLDEIIVVEEKRPFIELGIKDLLYGQPGVPAVSGKRSPTGQPIFRADADLPPHVIAGAIAPRLLEHLDNVTVRAWLERQAASSTQRARPLLPLLNRTPYFCSGCPHNRSTAVPAGSLVGSGIGCSTLSAMMPEEQVGNIVGMCQMGGEGTAWIGMAPFLAHDHLIQNLGDGTFHHSGSLAIRACVAAGVNITYKLLYNDAVAMTGGQQAVGKMAIPQIVAELLAEGVTKVVITTEDPKRYKKVRLPRGVKIRHRDRLIETQEELAEVPGVTVLIHDQECATELRRKRKRNLAGEPAPRVIINERVCEGCGDCGVKSNCLSVQPVETEFGRKTQIHQSSCNKDFSCLDGDCPSFISVIPGKKTATSAPRSLGAGDMPDPVIKVNTTDFNLRITGIGGTGVVTTAQIISTAAVMSGMHVRSLDQMGMAQKGGAVVSDIKLSTTPFTATNKLGPGECDLYLGCDLLVAAADTNLEVTSTSRTIAVVSTAQVPTGKMVTDTAVTFPDVDEVFSHIRRLTREPDSAFADVRTLVEALFGNDQYANTFLVGMAVQAGALPVGSAHIEQAIELNGVAVDRNIQAFRRGRQLIADPDAFNAALPTEPRHSPVVTARTRHIAELVRSGENTQLAEVVQRLVGELIAYQDDRYAEKYAQAVELARHREAEVFGNTGPITDAVAKNMYKLMAYKDEYEVARLCLAPTLERSIREQFGEGARYAFKLHPPILRTLGMERKISLGSWSKPAFKALYRMRRLRGTRLDPFGRGEVRETERSLIEEYSNALGIALSALTPVNLSVVTEIASLPDIVRGYEHIKLANVEQFRTKLAELTATL